MFRYSKNYGSLTHETRIKDAVNMKDLICLLATVRTLKVGFAEIFFTSEEYLYAGNCRNILKKRIRSNINFKKKYLNESMCLDSWKYDE